MKMIQWDGSLGRDRALASSSQEGSPWSPGRFPEVPVWCQPDPGGFSPSPTQQPGAALKSLLGSAQHVLEQFPGPSINSAFA